MSRFYFDLTNGIGTFRDEEGVEVSGLDEAVSEARAVLLELRDDVSIFEETIDWELQIREHKGPILRILPVI